MGSKKKDLEIIYSLQWKNKSSTNGGDKANIIGMYDIPTTTLNWETFKSYLLKNSGTVGEDVKVSYITSSNREFPIESQTDFQIALYAFRRKARMGDIVTLKLDRISDQQNYRNTRHSNDVETQFDNEAVSIVSSCCNSETPPEWFLTYMNKFKKNLTDDITASVASIVSNIKPHTVSQPSCYHSRKSKAENSKRRKLPLLTGEGSHESTKDLLKSLKLEGKLEHKLEKLESKTKKLKEKKLALFSKSSDSDGCTSSVKRRSSVPCEPEDDGFHMDAMPINVQQIIPHLLGGEIYLHQWKVLNSGKSAWTNETNLLYTWGAKALKPLETIISVPHLKAGETGTIGVRLQVPNNPGQYECYFNFHHRGRRFGHWLGCQIIVDPFDLKGNKSVLDTAYLNPVTCYENIWQGTSVASNAFSSSFNQSNQTQDDKTSELLPENKPDLFDFSESSNIYGDKIVRDITSRVEDIKLQDPTDTNCSSDSDNQSIISLPESNDSKGLPSEYVVVPIPDCFKVDDSPIANKTEATTKVEQPKAPEENAAPKAETSVENFDDNNNEDTNGQKDTSKNDETASNTSHKSDIVMVSIPETNQDSEEYACVIVDGQKVMIPKKIIKSEYLHSSPTEKTDTLVQQNPASSNVSVKENTPEPQTIKVDNDLETDGAEDVRNNFEEAEFNSHCSAAGSCFSESTAERNNRLFVFPPACPGYEVIRGEDFVNIDDEENYTWAKSDTHYAYSVQGMKEPLIPEIVPATEAINIPSSSGNPFVAPTISHVPNFQQTPPEERKCPSEENIRATFEATAEPPELGTEVPPPEVNRAGTPERPPSEDASAPPQSPHVVHILPEGLVNGAVNVARSVINRIVPQGSPGRWVNGHWVSTNPDSPREANLQALAEMGFWNRDLNASLLARYNDDLSRVVAELVQ
ncbi:uncharacterized protein [Diabrotica undecimpunctata]|uniref:uncharacterized protein n=1 Tax=Diabrotica undecimpunctata TaxID=50387 RepID=UPI003B637C5D